VLVDADERTQTYPASEQGFDAPWCSNRGVVVAMSFLIVSSIIVLNGHPIPGTILGSIDLVALVTVFVVGQQQREKELQNKRQVAASRK
jgi:hypothetical protein